MDISIETITPAIAAKMLETNTANRPLTKAIVERYAADIAGGRWVNDGSPIRFARCGLLLDGQHRLSAIVMAGKPIDAVVMRGLDDNAFTTMDTGKGRGGADILGIAGFKNYTVAASVAAAWLYYSTSGHPGNKGGARKVRNAEILEATQQNPEISEAANYYAGHKWIRSHISSTMFGALYVAACKRGERAIVLRFFGEIANPTTAAIGTSVMPLRERLIENRVAREKMAPTFQGAYLFKAYRDFRDGRSVKQLRVVLHNGGLTKEHFAL
jgi:hypothetical protein